MALLLFAAVQNVHSQPTALPLLQIDDLHYEGAFSIPGDDYGASNANYASGTIAYNDANNSLFLAGFNLHGAVAEFAIPALVNSTTLEDLNEATVLQNFRELLYDTPDGNPQGIDRVTGLYVYDNKLLVNAMEFYDAPANNTHTSLVVDNASELSSSAIDGYFQLEGEAHAAGWISQIPAEWQELLGGSHLSGNSSKLAINSRLTMGISAFVFEPDDLIDSNSVAIETTTLLDYDLSNPLYADFDAYEDGNYNVIEVNGETFPGHTVEDADIVVGENNIWTEDSQASYGVIVPGTRTYVTLGSSGGHNSGIGYKPTQSNGNLCGGPCPYDADDVYNYYWLWDVNDLLAVKNGDIAAYEVRPYAYGIFNAPFQTDAYYDNAPEQHDIVGGTYNAASNLLYLTIYDGASTGAYDRRPVIVAYSIDQEALSTEAIATEDAFNIIPNPANSSFTITGKNQNVQELAIYNMLGQVVKTTQERVVDISTLEAGVYIVQCRLEDDRLVSKQLIKN